MGGAPAEQLLLVPEPLEECIDCEAVRDNRPWRQHHPDVAGWRDGRCATCVRIKDFEARGWMLPGKHGMYAHASDAIRFEHKVFSASLEVRRLDDTHWLGDCTRTEFRTGNHAGHWGGLSVWDEIYSTRAEALIAAAEALIKTLAPYADGTQGGAESQQPAAVKAIAWAEKVIAGQGLQMDFLWAAEGPESVLG